MKNIYKDNFQKVEKKIQDLEKERNLLKWASRTGDEPDVWPPDRISWRKKIKEARKKIDSLIAKRTKS